nr:HNH endonuclease signature motif containing protein [Rhodococcus sp. (in: high G+C Gram-positive bacteria)]
MSSSGRGATVRRSLRGAFAGYTGPQNKPVIDQILLQEIADVAILENQACARKVALAACIWDSCIHQTIQVGEHITDAGNYAASETAAALGCSKTVADTLADIGMDLRLRLPGIRAAFDAGELDLARVRTIYRTTCWLTTAAAERVETEVLAAALRLSPGPLAAEINAIIQRTAPDEAADNRKSQTPLTRVRYRDKDVLATIEAELEAGDAAACWQLITEMAATLCPRDPRTRGQRHAAAYIALMHRESHLACTCDIDDEHPCTANRELPSRRTPLTTITIDLETLAGLADLPAYLAGHGLIDAEYARELTANGNLQLLLTEAIDLADTLGVRTASSTQGMDDPEAEDDSSSTPAEAGDVGETGLASPADTHGADDRADKGKPGTRLTFHPLGRGRRRGALTFPTRPAKQREGTTAAVANQPGKKYRGSYTLIAALERAIAAHPALGVALYPDGHGGVVEPPDGALGYRPSASLAECVRQRDRTCRHPGCDVAASGCEIDHVIPYLHRDPRRGGWTILTNLQCLCRYHHSLKTMGAWNPAMLAGAVLYWTSNSGTTAVTLPGSTIGTADLAPESLIPHIPRKRRSPDAITDEADKPRDDDKPAENKTAESKTGDDRDAHQPANRTVETDRSARSEETTEMNISMDTSIGVTAGIGHAVNTVDAGDLAPF